MSKVDAQIVDNQLVLVAALGRERSVTLTLHGLNQQGYFSRQTLSFKSEDARESMVLELFTSECRNLAMH
jgi:hypothetical protein